MCQMTLTSEALFSQIELTKIKIMFSQCQGLSDITNDQGLEQAQVIHFLTWEEYTFGSRLTSLPGQFQNIHSPDKLSDHDMYSKNFHLS